MEKIVKPPEKRNLRELPLLESKKEEKDLKLVNSANRSDMDRATLLNMEACASFMVRMIKKYGPQVLAEMENKKPASQDPAV